MSFRQFWGNFFALNKKWFTRIVIALLAAFFSAGVSLAFPKIGTGDWGLGITGETQFLRDWGKGLGGEKGGTSISIGLSQLPLSSSQSSITNSHQLLQQGAEFFQAEQFSAAATVWQEAASAFKASGDKLNQAQALGFLSLAYQQLGKWQEAKDAIASSLSLLRNLTRQKNSQLILAKALNTQGHLQLALGEAEQALKTWSQAAAIYSQLGDIEGTIGSQINVAQALQSLGNYRQARKTLEQLERLLKNRPNSLIKATGFRSLGNTLQVIGEFKKSREVLQESLTIAQELRSPTAISAAYFSLGNTARALAKKATELNDTSERETEIATALNAYQEVAETSTSPIMRSLAQVNQLSLLVETQQISEANSLRSQIQLDEFAPSRRVVYARIYLAESLIRLKTREELLALGNAPEETCTDSKRLFPHISPDDEDKETIAWSDIAKILATAVQQARSLKDTQAESYALGHLAELYALNGKIKESFNLTQQALVLAQAVNASDISYRWQWKLGQMLSKLGDSKGAIAAYSTAVETLKSLRGDLVAVNPNNQDVQFSFRDSVEPVYRELVDLLTTTEGEPSQENLRLARLTIESLQLAALDNFFQEPCLDAKPVQIDQIDSTVAVIYPIILPDRLGAIVALPQNELPLRYYATLKPKCETEKLLDELQQDIGRRAGNNERILELSQQVYDWIIRPAEAELKNSKVQTLVFVLDGLLRNIPMAALHDGKQYLIEKYSIALTPGLQLLPPQPLKPEQLRALTAGLSEANQNYSPLPYVKPELEGIQKLLNSQLLLNQEFTENNLQQALNSVPFPVVHIATHGQFSSQADRTFIVTWNSQINVKELDNLLRRREQEKPRPIELLVLSACETAEGDNRAALGLAGVAVRAGARSTLATLWRVNDKSTATLMVKFYQELAKEGVTKAQALRRAQLSLLENEYKSPYYWAPFVLVGNWR